MTEKEAIKVIEIAIAEVEWDYPLDYTVAFKTAIKALEEIQYYREIGTVEECKELAAIVNKVERNELAKIIDEWISYRKIGTVEECREVVEKQKPKKRIYPKTALERYYHAPECPNCKRELKPQICGYTLSQAIGIYSYCPWCGQAIDENLEVE